MIKIPQNNKVTISNVSDAIGSIYQTKNLNFDTLGKIKLADRSSVIADSGTESNLITATGMYAMRPAIESTGLYVAANKNLYVTNVSSAGAFPQFVQDSATGTPTLGSGGSNDMLIWDGDLFVTNGSDIYNYSGTPLVNSWATFSTESVFALEIFENLNQLAGASNSQVDLFDKAGDIVQTLETPEDFDVNCMAFSNERLYIGTVRGDGRRDSLILEWDGLGSSASNAYQVEGADILSLTAYKDGAVALASDGRIFYVRGGVEELDRLPIFDLGYLWSENGANSFSSNKVTRHALTTAGDKILISVASSISKAFSSNNVPRNLADFKSGVWVYDPKIGLYHRYSVGQSRLLRTNNIPTTNVATATGIITVAGATVPATGTVCFYTADYESDGTAIGGLVSDEKYYVIKLSDTTLKLATSRANSVAGTAITLTGTGNNSQYLTFHPEYDFGGIASNVTGVGFLQDAYTDDMPDYIANNIFICGYSIFGATTGRKTTVSSTQKRVENRGYFLTSKIKSQSLTDLYNSVYIKHEKFKNTEDNIVLKYRVSDTDLRDYVTYYEPNAVWTSSTTFTSTADLSDVVAGNEVEIIDGAGAGYLVHVTSIAEASGTYTVTVDEEIRNLTVNDISKVIFQNWIKVSPQETAEGYLRYSINKPGKWIQLKVELRGIGTTIEEIIINNKEHKPVI